MDPRGAESPRRTEQGLAISKDMFEERRERKERKNQGEGERADLRYKKASFEVLETFVCVLLLRSCAIIKDQFFSTQRPSSSSSSSSSSLSLLSFLFSSFLFLYSSPPNCICVSAEKPCIFCSRFDVLMTT